MPKDNLSQEDKDSIENFDKFDAELQVLAKKYNIGCLLVSLDKSDGIHITRNICAVCAMESLLQYVIEKRLTHFEEEPNERLKHMKTHSDAKH